MFAIVVLTTLGFLFKANHPELVGGEEDPENGPVVAGVVFTAVTIYAVCGLFLTHQVSKLNGQADFEADSGCVDRDSSFSAVFRDSYMLEKAGEVRLRYRRILREGTNTTRH